MKLEDDPCPLCESTARRLFTVQRGFLWHRCAACGVAYLSPRPEGSVLGKAYEAYLPETPEGIASWHRLMRGVFQEALGLLGEPGPTGGSLLDVGCAFGFFLEEAEKRGWKAVGIDLSPPAVALARDHGLDARLLSAESADFPADSYDAVTLFYVLEHVAEPRAVLERVHRWLRPGGTLLLRVPHTAPLVRLLDAVGLKNELFDPPHHLVDFPPRALERLLRDVRFEGVRTFPGASTNPAGIGTWAVTKSFSLLAGLLYTGTFGRYLLPGVSKTTCARKPLGG